MACRMRAQKKTMTHQTVTALWTPVRCATTTRPAKAPNCSTRLTWARSARLTQCGNSTLRPTRYSSGVSGPAVCTLPMMYGIHRTVSSTDVRNRYQSSVVIVRLPTELSRGNLT